MTKNKCGFQFENIRWWPLFPKRSYDFNIYYRLKKMMSIREKYYFDLIFERESIRKIILKKEVAIRF
ncbi:MAG TPA: hypothetical protein ENI07_10945 [Desulfobacterales bacterium]|nr:hypothetical protein [Desulfobacterales bacterium]